MRRPARHSAGKLRFPLLTSAFSDEGLQYRR